MKNYQAYEHKAQYYETDQMGIIHHSNYIRWFEEARIDMMEQAGMPYKDLEAAGIVSAVLEASSKYRSMAHFGDVVAIGVKLVQYNSATMTLSYEITDKRTKELRCTGETKHCFLNRERKLVSLRKINPQYHQLFLDLLE